MATPPRKTPKGMGKRRKATLADPQARRRAIRPGKGRHLAVQFAGKVYERSGKLRVPAEIAFQRFAAERWVHRESVKHVLKRWVLGRTSHGSDSPDKAARKAA